MLAIQYISIGILILFIELYRKRPFTFDLLIFFHIYFFLVYVFAPLFLLSDLNLYADNKLKYGLIFFGNGYTPLIIFISYVLFLFGYYSKTIRKVSQRLIFKIRIGEKLSYHLLLFGLILVAFSIFVYVKQYGGVKSAVIKAELIRNGLIEATNVSFVKRFFNISTLGLYFSFLNLIDITGKTPKVKDYFYFISFLCMVLIIGALYASRGYILITIGGLYLILSIKNRKYYFIQLSILILIGIVFIFYGDAFFRALPYLFEDSFESFQSHYKIYSNAVNERGLSNFVKNFTHPIVSFETSLANSGWNIGFRYFKDIPIAVLSLIPEKLLNVQVPNSVATLNTYLLLGVEDSIIPPGILGFLSYSFSFVGVFVGMYFLGIFGRFLMEVLKNIIPFNKKGVVFLLMFSIIYGQLVFNGDLRVIIQSNFNFIFLVFILVITAKFYIRK